MATEPQGSGFHRLHDAAANKSTAFSAEERERYKLRGLLPARVCGQDMQVERVLENLRRKEHDIERYIYLLALQGRNERLYYRTLMDHIDEIMPIVYTPTVGQACKEFAHIFRQPRGFYITPNDRGAIRKILDNWPTRDVRVIVVTDGERILGLGDLGANGMGIPIGKLALYSACAGIDPQQCMPIQIDVGTNNEELLQDPLYLGLQMQRLGGDAYVELMDEFMQAVADAYPKALVQFEDFLTPNAYALLHRYRERALCFNDDIQGTAAVALAGVMASTRMTGTAFEDLRVMFLGAGSAATGIGDLIAQALVECGLEPAEARRRLWFNDRKGLIVSSRKTQKPHSAPYAHDHPAMEFADALRAIKPHVLIGATGQPGAFTQDVIQAMAAMHERPVVFALSNPTSRAECTAEQAYQWSEGRAVFASGSPFAPVKRNGRELHPAQGNNAYVFPGVGLGVVACEATRVTDGMFLSAARTLAEVVTQERLDTGALYPKLSEIRDVSLAIATAVMRIAYEEGVARTPRPDSDRAHIAAMMYDPTY